MIKWNWVLFFCWSSPTFFRIIKNKTVEEFKPDPYIATVLNCLFWIFYGMPFVHPDSILVITINSIGLALELTYLTIFFIFATSQGRVRIYVVLLMYMHTYLSHSCASFFILQNLTLWLVKVWSYISEKGTAWACRWICFLCNHHSDNAVSATRHQTQVPDGWHYLRHLQYRNVCLSTYYHGKF